MKGFRKTRVLGRPRALKKPRRMGGEKAVGSRRAGAWTQQIWGLCDRSSRV